jgi:hypothetical protein
MVCGLILGNSREHSQNVLQTSRVVVVLDPTVLISQETGSTQIVWITRYVLLFKLPLLQSAILD